MTDNYSTFKQIIRESNYDNTYKMAWAKALVELSTQIATHEPYVTISFNEIAKKYLKYYWNQTIFFDLKQGSNPLKPPKILTLTKEMIEQYFINTKSNNPVLYEKAEAKFEKHHLIDIYEKTIKDIVSTLKQDVSWRFLNINGNINQLYKYTKGNDYLVIENKLLQQLKENEQDLYDLINYRWGLILETFNSSPRINKKVKIMDEREIKRNSLIKYKTYLDLENEEHHCFLCGQPINENNLSIDHVIPWSYMYSDDIWNLVYVCKSCNSIKSNKIPTIKDINNLKARNITLLNQMENHHIYNKLYDELKTAIDKDYIDKFWVGSKS
ncbi:MAG: HNH endonuclease domain-containing protein [Erysipelotrichaceae bacterium]